MLDVLEETDLTVLGQHRNAHPVGACVLAAEAEDPSTLCKIEQSVPAQREARRDALEVGCVQLWPLGKAKGQGVIPAVALRVNLIRVFSGIGLQARYHFYQSVFAQTKVDSVIL